MSDRILIAGAGELWTCESAAPRRGAALRDLANSSADSVAIVEGKVAESGSESELRQRYTDLPVLSASGRLVTPGLIDPHTHIVFAGDRSAEFARRCAGETYQEIAAKGGGIAATVGATREAGVEELVEGALPRLDLMLRHGTTTAEIKTGYGLDEATELRMLDAIALANARHPVDLVPTFLGAHIVAPKMDAESYVQLLGQRLIISAAHHVHPPAFNDVFCERGAFTLEQSRRILEAGLEHGLVPKIHAEQFTRTGATLLGVELGAASADHLVKINEEDIAALAASETVAVPLPGVEFYLHAGERPPVRRMIDAGCIVALATDYNPGSCYIGSMPFVMGLGCLQLGMKANEALAAATVNAAAALRLQASHGQLAPGFVGDAVVWDAPSLDALLGEFVHPRVRAVVKKGRVVYRSGLAIPSA